MKRLVAFALLGLLALCSCQEAAPPPPPPPDPVPRAELDRLPSEGKAALVERLDRLEATPGSSGWGPLALDLHALLLLKAADAAYSRARMQAPYDVRWSYLSAYLAYQDRRREEALDRFEQVLRLAPGDPGALYWKGRILYELQRFDLSRQVLNELRELRPEHAAARAFLGHLAGAEGRFPEAVENYEAALALQPGATELHYPLAQALRHLGRGDEAERRTPGDDKVIRDDPHLERLLERTRELRDEMTELMAPSRSPEDPRLAEGEALAKHGRWSEALAVFGAALEEAETPDAEARARFGQAMVALEERGDCDFALPELERVLEISPEVMSARLASVDCLARLGRWQEVAFSLRLGLESYPEASALEQRLVRVLAASPVEAARNGPEGYRRAESLLQREPSGESLEALAMAAAELGRWPEAIELQQRALEAARNAGRQGLLPFLEHNHRNYQQHRPSRDPWPIASPAQPGNRGQ